MVKNALKSVARLFGLNVEWRDRLAEQIPMNYERSVFLPRLTGGMLERTLYFDEIVRRVKDVPGVVVECGVSIGHGILLFSLLHHRYGIQREVFGFDSFEGFPSPSAEDGGTHAYQGYYSTPPAIVMRVLSDGGVPHDFRQKRVHLVKGFFAETLPPFDREIAILHLDCDLYDSYAVALDQLFPRVSSGGAILFDEYGSDNFPGAKKAVDEYFCDRVECIQRHPSGKYYVIKGCGQESVRASGRGGDGH